jgi:hypothetical protein
MARRRSSALHPSVRHGFQEGLVVAVFEENLLTCIAAVENMVAQIANRGSRRSRHRTKVNEGQGNESRKIGRK